MKPRYQQASRVLNDRYFRKTKVAQRIANVDGHSSQICSFPSAIRYTQLHLHVFVYMNFVYIYTICPVTFNAAVESEQQMSVQLTTVQDKSRRAQTHRAHHSRAECTRCRPIKIGSVNSA